MFGDGNGMQTTRDNIHDFLVIESTKRHGFLANKHVVRKAELAGVAATENEDGARCCRKFGERIDLLTRALTGQTLARGVAHDSHSLVVG